MKKAVEKDRSTVAVSELSKLGLMEITRKRVCGPPLVHTSILLYLSSEEATTLLEYADSHPLIGFLL